jgi:hypothetical protein
VAQIGKVPDENRENTRRNVDYGKAFPDEIYDAIIRRKRTLEATGPRIEPPTS